MGKSKEEDRIEKLIRGLLKLPENRRCINCNSLGPQYVCTTFWIFVCTNCSGVHREFTHRVKSVSMAKFTLEEVNALQAGGNERARQIYFKTWDPQRNFFPDNSNIQRLRDFIKHVYEDRRFTGESHPALLPRLRKSEKDESCETRSVDSAEKYTFHERSIDRYSRYSYDEVRSPGYKRGNTRYGGFRGGVSRLEDIDGRYQVDNTKIAGRAATQMFTTADIKLRRTSPDRHQSRDINSPPPVRHVKEIFGDKFLPLRVRDHPNSIERRSVHGTANSQQADDHSKPGNRTVDGPVHGQEGHAQQPGDHSGTNHRRSNSAYQSIVRSGSQTSVSNAAIKPKSESTGSLVDFATFPSPDASDQKQAQQIHATKDGGNIASPHPPVKETSAPPQNTLEFLLFELSTPADTTPTAGVPGNDNAASSAHSTNSSTLHHMSTSSTSGNPPITSSVSLQPNIGLSEPSTLEMVPTLSDKRGETNGAPTSSGAVGVSTSDGKPARSSDTGTPKAALPQTVPDLLGGDDVCTMQQADQNQSSSIQRAEHSSTPVSDKSSAPQTCHINGVTNNQPATLSLLPSTEVNSGNRIAQSPHPALGPTQETKSADRIHPSPAEAKSGGRAELPADLFASLYPSGPSGPVPVPGWQTAPSHNMGFNMQYQPALMQIPAFPNVAKSTNPFDISDNTAQNQATTFSSMTYSQGGLPNVSAPPGILRSSSFGSNVPGLPPTQSPSYSSGAYMGQHLYNNLPSSRLQGLGGFGIEGGMPGSLGLNQQNPYTYQAPSNPGSSHTSGGNPFG